MKLNESTRDWRALAHRWFVQYNPLYLISAALVLVGVFLMSRGLSLTEGILAELWLTGITELYQLLLMGSAALLYRAGQRRPAVMLALLDAVYLGDLTFQTGVSPLLGNLGVAASVAWYALYLIKLRALAWAVRVEAGRTTWLLLMVGGAFLAGGPHLLYAVDSQLKQQLLIMSAFGFSAAGTWLAPKIQSTEGLDGWGHTVLRRVQWVGWKVWGALLLGHMFWWCGEHGLAMTPVVLGAILPWLVHRTRSEVEVWLLAGGVLAAGVYQPGIPLPLAALLAACALCLRAWRGPGFGLVSEPQPGTAQVNPYRMAPLTWDEEVAAPRRPAIPTRAERLRLVVGTLCCGYISGFMGLVRLSWGMEPYLITLSVVTSAALLLLALKFGSRLAILPLTGIVMKYGIILGLVFIPSGSLQWGILLLALGFISLLAGVGINWRMAVGANLVPSPTLDPPRSRSAG